MHHALSGVENTFLSKILYKLFLQLNSQALLKAKYCPRDMPVQHFVNPGEFCPGGLCPVRFCLFYTYPEDFVRGNSARGLCVGDFVRDYVWKDFAKCNLP